MSRQESWETIARALGERMAYHAYCADHPPDRADPTACPYCDDRAAYQRYERRAGRVVDPLENAPTVRIEDL